VKRQGALDLNPRRLSELDHRERRRAIIRTTAIVGASWVGLFGVYYALPVQRHSERDDVLRLAVGLAVVACFLAWQTTRIVQDEVPELRAAQTLGVTVPLLLVVFAGLYLSMAHSSSSNFSEPLDHTGALYFTITVFSTVGFGDITPRTDPARLVVSVQMLLDLVVIGFVVRVLFNAAEMGLSRRGRSSSGGGAGTEGSDRAGG
jgi:hypothetical protein